LTLNCRLLIYDRTVLAALKFVRNGGKWAAIGALEDGHEVFKGRRGTLILP